MHYLELLTSLLEKFSYLGNWLFGALALAESVPFLGTIVPGATLISVGGFMAAQGYFNPYVLGLYVAIGAVLGDFLSYYLGTRGENFAKRFISDQYLEKGRQFFDKYGNKSVFIGRFIGPLRAVVPFIAGISKMKRRAFLFWNISSSIAWSAFHVVFGYFSGTVAGMIFKNWSHRLSRITIGLLLALGIIWVLRKEKIVPEGFFWRWPRLLLDRAINPAVDYLSRHFILFFEYFRIERNFKKFMFITHLISAIAAIFIIAELADVVANHWQLDF